MTDQADIQIAIVKPQPRRSRSEHSFLLVCTVVGLLLTPALRAVTPPPDGGYINENTAEGTNALFSLTDGFDNTAIGFKALFTNNTGAFNTAVGDQALLKNSSGHSNTATGFVALANNTIGEDNTADGVGALISNTTGNTNTATGDSALHSNTTGSSNIAIGFEALLFNTTGNNNIAVGDSAGANLTTGSNNIDIGALGVAGEANTIRIGKSGTQKKTLIAGIRGVTVANGIGVFVNSSGQLGTVVSSARFKEAIKPMDKASEAILALKPVTFRYKEELDPEKIPQFGLIAEEVEKVNRDLVVRDEDGKVNTVRYEAVNAMLLNEFLKEHSKVEALEAKMMDQQKEIKKLTSAFQEHALQIEKVNARLAAGQSVRRVVVND
jgi:hypothetical protein